MQLASDMELRMPEPCAPVSVTCCLPLVSVDTMARWYSVRPGFFRMACVLAILSKVCACGFVPIS